MNDPRKPMFAAARLADPDGILTPEDVAKIDAALDAAGVPRPAIDAPADETGEMTIGENGIALLHGFEGFARLRSDGMVEAYPDPATGGAPWTIGFGNTTDSAGAAIRRGTIWTRKQAEDRFIESLEETYLPALRRALGGADTSQEQFDAMASFIYNLGETNFRKSTLLRKHKAGDYAGAAAEFKRWNRAGGRVMRGLTRRRAAEAKLYRSGS